MYDLEFLQQNMFVIPLQEMLEYQNGHMSIYPEFNKLITALRTAVEDGNGSLQKEETSHSDVFDAFRLSLHFWY